MESTKTEEEKLDREEVTMQSSPIPNSLQIALVFVLIGLLRTLKQTLMFQNGVRWNGNVPVRFLLLISMAAYKYLKALLSPMISNRECLEIATS